MGVADQPGDIGRGELDPVARACGEDDAVESLLCERVKERVAVAAAMADARIDADAEVTRTPADAGQRFRHLMTVTERSVQGQIQRDPLQTHGNERGVLGSGDPQGRVEGALWQGAIGERQQDPRPGRGDR
jgi:hypothetical protein